LRSPGPKRNAENQTDAASRRKQITDSLRRSRRAANESGKPWMRGSRRPGSPGAANIILSLRSSREHWPAA
jgi:hypothetical protein